MTEFFEKKPNTVTRGNVVKKGNPRRMPKSKLKKLAMKERKTKPRQKPPREICEDYKDIMNNIGTSRLPSLILDTNSLKVSLPNVSKKQLEEEIFKISQEISGEFSDAIVDLIRERDEKLKIVEERREAIIKVISADIEKLNRELNGKDAKEITKMTKLVKSLRSDIEKRKKFIERTFSNPISQLGV